MVPYDVLSDGDMGAYWENGILLKTHCYKLIAMETNREYA